MNVLQRWMGVGAGLVAGLSAATPAVAQTGSGSVGAGVLYQTFNFDAEGAGALESLSLLTIPLSARARLGGGVTLELQGAYAQASQSWMGLDLDMSGLTDTQLSLSAPFADGAVVLTALAVLPTGAESIEAREVVVAGTLASDLLPLAVTSFGSGGGVGGSVAVSRAVGDFGLGLSVGYVVAGSYQPLEASSAEYRPGDALRVNAVVDRGVGGAGKLSFRLSLQHFSDDVVNDQNLFRSGDRYEGLASYSFAAGPRSSGLVYAAYQRRERGTFVVETDVFPSQDLVMLGGGARVPVARGHLLPSVDLRLNRREDGGDQGYTVGVGASLEWPAGGVTLVPRLRGYLGSAELGSGVDSGFWGVETGLSVRFGWRRP